MSGKQCRTWLEAILTGIWFQPILFAKTNHSVQRVTVNMVVCTLTLVLLNKLRCQAFYKFSANQISWSRLLTSIHILNGKQCRSRERSQLVWIYTVCKGRTYSGLAELGLKYIFRKNEQKDILQQYKINLMLSTLGNNFSRQQSEIFFLLFPENRRWHCM